MFSADLIINEDPGGASREWVIENISVATAFFFRGHYKIDKEVLDKGSINIYLISGMVLSLAYFSQKPQIFGNNCGWTW